MAALRHDVDALIIGGGPAGLSAALCLGRARREVVVLDAGAPRHAVADGVHNFLTREGLPPAELRRVAWEQLAAFPNVTRTSPRRVTRLVREAERWVAEDDQGEHWRGRAALLATGVIDEHPDIPGYRERWGRSIFLCPFCHGWEHRGQPLAVLGSGDQAVHLGRLLTAWSDDVAVLTHGRSLTAEQRDALDAVGVAVHDSPIARLAGRGHELETIEFADGRSIRRQALWAVLDQHHVPVVQSLGLALTDAGSLQLDAQLRTSQPWLWAAGDVSSRLQQVVEAAAQGLRAGAQITAALVHPGHGA